MALIDLMKDAFADIFSEFKESVTLKSVAKDWDAEDDFTPTFTDTTEDAIIVVMTETLSQEVGGELNVGDALGYFKPAVDIKKDDKVEHNGILYVVKELNKEEVGPDEVLTEVKLAREK